MITPNSLTQVREALTPAQTILVALPQKLNLDKAAAGLSLYLSLKKTKKEVFIFSPKAMTVEFSSLVGAGQIKQKMKGRNLVISFDYVEDSIEKVSYNIENNKFNLVIQPKEGFSPLSTEKIDYSYSGSQANLIFVIGARNFDDLGNVYFQNKKTFGEGKTVNLNIRPTNKPFANVDLVDPQASSYSEMVTLMLSRLNLPIDGDIAANLLSGIQKATAGFSLAKTGPGAFEAAAFCLRAGAKTPKKGAPLKPMSPKISAEKKPKPSPDWLEPKIYKGNTLV